jgi:transposase-like protein
MTNSVAHYFANPHTCERLVWQIRWPDGYPVCPHCRGVRVVAVLHHHNLRCKDCRRQFSVKYGTLFEHSRLSLGQWLYSVYLLIHHPNVPCRQLADEVNVTLLTGWHIKRLILAGLCQIRPSDNYVDILRQLIFLKKSDLQADFKSRKFRQKTLF